MVNKERILNDFCEKFVSFLRQQRAGEYADVSDETDTTSALAVTKAQLSETIKKLGKAEYFSSLDIEQFFRLLVDHFANKNSTNIVNIEELKNIVDKYLSGEALLYSFYFKIGK